MLPSLLLLALLSPAAPAPLRPAAPPPPPATEAEAAGAYEVYWRGHHHHFTAIPGNAYRASWAGMPFAGYWWLEGSTFRVREWEVDQRGVATQPYDGELSWSFRLERDRRRRLRRSGYDAR